MAFVGPTAGLTIFQIYFHDLRFDREQTSQCGYNNTELEMYRFWSFCKQQRNHSRAPCRSVFLIKLNSLMALL